MHGVYHEIYDVVHNVDGGERTVGESLVRKVSEISPALVVDTV